ncbi:hypothetical protein HPB52_011260 [Rhipicephalus sanguineus]|uniref:Uncharacterized protein n=1 Tax=Rhipicephalus sanguineus TaxID=34632 RepID=A0A9D4PZN2_RHISA|nr:hypothetical protein HPB52_011260 [Rhipicephalus sanguineus]
MCSEWWRNARFYQDELRIICGEHETKGPTHRRQQRMYRDWCRIADQTSECLWLSTRTRPLPKKTSITEKGKVLALGDITVPKTCTSILQKGPEFATEPRLSPVDKVLHS